MYLNDDKYTSCYKVLSEDLFDELTEQHPLKLESSKAYWDNVNIVASMHLDKKQYEICHPIYSLSSGKWLRREPSLPTLGMYLERVLVQIKNKVRPMAVVLCFERKFIVPLHFLSSIKTEKELK